jgi:Flp pilus assembly protein TadG
VAAVLQRFRRDERGIAASIVLFPLFAVVTFMFVQTISWQRDRDLASATADQASTAVALYGATPGSAQADAQAELRRAGVRNVSVSINRGDDLTVVDVSGDAPGILVGTSARVHARSVTPTDRFDTP